MTNKREHYRPDVDGLRAVAVISVVLFHLGAPFMGGGFVGVDVFFVISGYLVTLLLVRELQETGGIDFGRFYARRVMRLAPALVVTLLATYVAAITILGPQEVQELAASMLAALASVANVHYWLGAGYFDADAYTKPLLHTWSLGVEEQFYLFWPLLMVLAWSAGRVGAALAVLGLTSFVANLLMFSGLTTNGASTAFYLPMFRVWEFAIGAGLVLLERRVPAGGSDLCVKVGLAFIVIPAIAFGDGTPFPSWNAVWPCVGAALVIWGGRGRSGTRLLGNPTMVAVGRASYSLYLVHWPVIVLFYAQTFRLPNALEAIVLLGTMAGLAGALHVLVEQPIRRRRFSLKFAALAVVGVAVLCAAAIPDGFAFRVPSAMREIYASTMEEAGASASLFRSKRCFTSGQSAAFLADFDVNACVSPVANKRPVLIAGDSSAAYAYAGMVGIADANNIDLLQLTMTGCEVRTGPNNDACVDLNNWFWENLQKFNGMRVVLMAHWGTSGIDHIGDTVRALNAEGIDAYVVGPSLSFEHRLPSVFAGAVTIKAGIERGRGAIQSHPRWIDSQMRAQVEQAGGHYFSAIDHICGGSFPSGCNLIPSGSALIAMDTLHMTHSAAAQVFSSASFLR